jgi:hypothetical protein
MLDGPPLFRIEFFEMGDGHWLRISMEQVIHGTTFLVLFATRLR